MNSISSKDRTIVFILIVLLSVSCNSSKPKESAAEVIVPLETISFDVGDIILLEGPFKESLDAEAKYLRSLDIDRLIAPFRRESGLVMKNDPYSGWENSLPGVALSLYLSGVSRLYAQTGEQLYLQRIDYILEELKLCQSKRNGFLLGSKDGMKVFARLEKEGYYEEFSDWPAGHGTPYYVMEKLFSGLLDVYTICQKEEALQIAIDLANWLSHHMSKLSPEDMQKIMTVEYGGMNWVLTDLYIITGNRKYLKMSKRWHDNEVVVPLTRKEDVLTGIHANTQFPKMSGLAARYPYTGDSCDWIGPSFFWERVVNHRTYVTGGNSEGEEFSKPDSLAHTLTQFTEENCNEYNMLKLTSLLNSIDPRVEYADYIERTLWNHLLAAQNLIDGRVCYYLPLMSGASRDYQTLYNSFTCCVCSGMDSYTRHAEYIYTYSDSDIFVDQFIASALHWKEKDFQILQETKFPFEEKVRLQINCNKPIELGLKIRSPYWLSKPLVIAVNGDTISNRISDGYIRIFRKWQANDVVEFDLPMDVRFEQMPDDENKIALFYGPILLSARLDDELASSLVERNIDPALIPEDLPVNKWLIMKNDSLEFITMVTYPKDLTVKPFFLNKAGCYSVYWQKIDETALNNRIQEKHKTDQYKKNQDHATIDKIVVGDTINEMLHQISGNSYLAKGNKGIDTESYWRIATDSTGLGYKLRVNNDSKIQMRFLGPAHYDTWNCLIEVNNTILDTLIREKEASSPSHLVLTYSIEDSITNYKDSIDIHFVVEEGWQMPKLIEIRSISTNTFDQ